MEKKTLSETRTRVDAFLRANKYAESNIKNFNHTWDHLADFMKAKGEKYYSREVGDAFLDACHDGKSYKQLTVRQKERVRHGRRYRAGGRDGVLLYRFDLDLPAALSALPLL